MAVSPKVADKRKNFMVYDIREAEAVRQMREMIRNNRALSPKTHMEQEKRIRREIANSNERRRMQSINTGFESLKNLLPQQDGEKLSKAAILQQSVECIEDLQEEKAKLLAQNAHLRHIIQEMKLEAENSDSPPPKRKKRDTESSDEGISMSMDEGIDDMRRELAELRTQLDRERRLRIELEAAQQQRVYETRYYPDHVHEMTKQVHQTKISSPEIKPEPTHVESRLEPMDSSRPEPIDRLDDPSYTPPSTYSPLQSSMSRRNLETIVEAIRHLEGDQEEQKCGKISRSSSSSLSDQEDTKSDSSGHGSLSSQGREMTPPHNMYSLHSNSYTCSVNTERYPIAMHLLHHPHPYSYTRPGVIVHKSS